MKLTEKIIKNADSQGENCWFNRGTKIFFIVHPSSKDGDSVVFGQRKKNYFKDFFNSDFLAFVANKIDADFIQKYYRSIFSIICCNNTE